MPTRERVDGGCERAESGGRGRCSKGKEAKGANGGECSSSAGDGTVSLWPQGTAGPHKEHCFLTASSPRRPYEQMCLCERYVSSLAMRWHRCRWRPQIDRSIAPYFQRCGARAWLMRPSRGAVWRGVAQCGTAVAGMWLMRGAADNRRKALGKTFGINPGLSHVNSSASRAATRLQRLNGRACLP